MDLSNLNQVLTLLLEDTISRQIHWVILSDFEANIIEFLLQCCRFFYVPESIFICFSHCICQPFDVLDWT